MVHSVLDNGDLSVLYGSKRWTLNPVSVVKVGGSWIRLLSVYMVCSKYDHCKVYIYQSQ